MVMRPYLICVAKAAAVTAIATIASWLLFDVLYAWAEQAAEAQIASGDEWFAGSTQYIIADLTGILFLPLAVWAGLRLIRVKGNHLAVVIAGITWVSLTMPHLLPFSLSTIWWMTVEVLATAAAAVLQAATFSSVR